MDGDERGTGPGPPLKAHQASQVREADRGGKRETLLESLRQAHLALQKARETVVQRVADGRAAGATWAKIAAEVGMQQPNAVRKYKPLLPKDAVVSGGRNSDESLKALANLRAAHLALQEAEQLVVERVAECRNAAETWDEIAERLDMKQGNAVAKFKPLLVEERTVSVRREVQAGA